MRSDNQYFTLFQSTPQWQKINIVRIFCEAKCLCQQQQPKKGSQRQHGRGMTTSRMKMFAKRAFNPNDQVTCSNSSRGHSKEKNSYVFAASYVQYLICMLLWWAPHPLLRSTICSRHTRKHPGRQPVLSTKAAARRASVN